jgi:hypothetical protein
MELLTICPCAFFSVWVAVSILPSAEIATIVVTVTLRSTLLTNDFVGAAIDALIAVGTAPLHFYPARQFANGLGRICI